jgi:hypothetical protein
MDEKSTGGQSSRQRHWRPVQRGLGFGTLYRRNHSPQLSTELRQESLGNKLSISEMMMAPIDANVSIGTFVQLIRRLTSGPIKVSRRI